MLCLFLVCYLKYKIPSPSFLLHNNSWKWPLHAQYYKKVEFCFSITNIYEKASKLSCFNHGNFYFGFKNSNFLLLLSICNFNFNTWTKIDKFLWTFLKRFFWCLEGSTLLQSEWREQGEHENKVDCNYDCYSCKMFIQNITTNVSKS